MQIIIFLILLGGIVKMETNKETNKEVTVENLIKNAESLSDINDIISKIDPSLRYEVINTIVESIDSDVIDMLKDERWNKSDAYRTYQQLKQEAVEMHKYDETPAKMIDVDRACTKVYTILLRMISILNNKDEELLAAINDLEILSGKKLTEWSDNNGLSNVQGKQDTTE